MLIYSIPCVMQIVFLWNLMIKIWHWAEYSVCVQYITLYHNDFIVIMVVKRFTGL